MYSILKIALFIISIVLYNSYSNGSTISDENEEGERIVPKCCPVMNYVYCDYDDNCSCKNDDLAMDRADFSKVPVYNENLEYTGHNLTDIFMIVNGSLQKDYILIGESEQPYLLENGKLHVIISIPNTPEKVNVMDKENYCVDYMKTNESEHPKITFRITMPDPDRSFKIKLDTAGYIISSIFLALVLVVYSMFAPLRNLVGKIIMCLAASLLSNYLAFSVLILKTSEQGDVTTAFCLGTNFCIYLFLLASFFWMNVLSFDIWKRFRRMTHQRSYFGRGLFRHKFLMYSIYAWGTPSVMGIIMILIEIDEIDVRSMPRFIKPNFVLNGCFFGDTELMLYFYTPMLILILCNWIFYFMTAYAIWLVKRDSRTLGVTSTPNNIKERLKICLRLSLVMGITWVLEVVSATTPELPIWYITDFYNILNGVGIFVITVCNKKVYKLIVQRFGSRPSFKTSKSSRQTPDSTLSDEPTKEAQWQKNYGQETIIVKRSPA